MDVTSWTDDELCRELAAWAEGGQNARLPGKRAHDATNEYARRMGVVSGDAYCSFSHALQAVQDR